MQEFITQALQLGLWHTLDIQFAKTLVQTISQKTTIKEYKKEALMIVGTCLSSAIRSGNTCLPLLTLSPNKLFQGLHLKLAEKICKKIEMFSLENWLELLSDTMLIKYGTHPAPLVLDDKCLYMCRMWQDECLVSEFFSCTSSSNEIEQNKISVTLNQLFSISNFNKENNWIKTAISISLMNQRILIDGEPGTGKTSTIIKIIVAWLLYNNNNNNNKLNIKITTPTGKASMLLSESLNFNKYNNIIQLNNSSQFFLPKKAVTIHNLLGSRLYNKNIQHTISIHPLNVDFLIIDEASMVSLSIFAKIIAALPKNVKIILSGDRYQLPSIGPGYVFQDISQFSNFHYSFERQEELKKIKNFNIPKFSKVSIQHKHNSIIDGTCVLKKNYRFKKNSGIYQLSIAIKSGNYNQTLSLLHSHIYTDLHYVHCKEKKDYSNFITYCALKYHHYLTTLLCKKSTIIQILKIFNKHQVICALRDGPFGVIQINYYIEQILHQNGLIQYDRFGNYLGKPIIILHNNPLLELYNGEIGVLLLNSQEQLSAYFLQSNDGVKIIPIHQLPTHETCFAITIHKSQGSEFQDISVILPNQHTPILTRELLYTATTRARQYLSLYATDEIIIKSINLRIQRYSKIYKKIYKNISH